MVSERDAATERVPAAVIGPVRAPAVHVMSWNIRRLVPGILARPADRWGRRAPGVSALLSLERPTVLCAQEVLPEQLGALQAGLGEGYRHLGGGRSASGGGEACPIVYDSARLDLAEWEQSALSDTPQRPGSISWGNPFPRILVRAVFRDRATGCRFRVINTHLDPFSARSRRRSAAVIGEMVNQSGVSTVVTGDLNAGPSSEAVRELLAAGLVDSWSGAARRMTRQWGTHGGYRRPRAEGTRIDWILTTPGLGVSAAAINPYRHEGGWPSDHLPVQAVVVPGSAAGDRDVTTPSEEAGKP